MSKGKAEDSLTTVFGPHLAETSGFITEMVEVSGPEVTIVTRGCQVSRAGTLFTLASRTTVPVKHVMQLSPGETVFVTPFAETMVAAPGGALVPQTMNTPWLYDSHGLSVGRGETTESRGFALTCGKLSPPSTFTFAANASPVLPPGTGAVLASAIPLANQNDRYMFIWMRIITADVGPLAMRIYADKQTRGIIVTPINQSSGAVILRKPNQTEYGSPIKWLNVDIIPLGRPVTIIPSAVEFQITTYNDVQGNMLQC